MLVVYTIEQNETWDAVVRSFADYDVYYLSGYAKAFQIHGDGEPLLFSYEGNNIRGINVIMKRDISRDARFEGKIEANTSFDFVTPYGYGGWLIEGEGDTAQLFTIYEAWCREHSIVSEFVRFHPVLENHKLPGISDVYNPLSRGVTITMDLSNPDVIWANLTSKNRNVIRKAQKAGVVIYNGRYPEIFEKFRTVYNCTMDKDNAESYYYFKPEFYTSILSDLSNEAQIFYAVFNGQVIAASIILAANGRLNYHLSGSIREYQNLAPTNLLLYHAALWGYSNGCRTFHLGGGVGSTEDSLYKFKSAFYRNEPCRFYIGQKVWNSEIYDRLVKMRENINISRFFPKYRA